MRDIRFRGKRIDTGEWVYGAYFCLHHNDERQHVHHFIIPDDADIPKDRPIGDIQVEVDSATVGQYTGLECDNGSVYEGDIIWWSDMQPFSYVFFGDGAFRMTDPDSDTSELLIDVLMGAKIIGNLFENPELLEVAP